MRASSCRRGPLLLPGRPDGRGRGAEAPAAVAGTGVAEAAGEAAPGGSRGVPAAEQLHLPARAAAVLRQPAQHQGGEDGVEDHVKGRFWYSGTRESQFIG